MLKENKHIEEDEVVEEFEWFDPREEYLQSLEEECDIKDQLEKGDTLALILSGFVVVGPVLIILILLAIWLF